MRRRTIACAAAALLLAAVCPLPWAAGGAGGAGGGTAGAGTGTGIAVGGAAGANGAAGSVSPSIVVSETADSLVCRDADGNAVPLKKRPQRVIVNYTSLIGIWYAAGGTAVAMPDTQDMTEVPPAARGIATTGKTTAPNVERILSLSPDLVILASAMTPQRAVADILKENGIQCILLRYETFDDYIGVLDLFLRLNGKSLSSDPNAVSIVRGVDATVGKSVTLPPLRFLSLFASVREVQAETSRAHTAFIASALGGRNIVASGGPQSPLRVRLSMERITMEDPDVIFVTTMGDQPKVQARMKEDFMASDAWKGLRAVKSGRVYFLPNDLFFYKPNERFPEAYRYLAAILHPGETWK